MYTTVLVQLVNGKRNVGMIENKVKKMRGDKNGLE